MQKCMICQSVQSTVTTEDITLCPRCLEAIYTVMKPKIQQKKYNLGKKPKSR